MLDDLRNSSSFIDEEDTLDESEVFVRRPARGRQDGTFLGMTAPQRFILSLMLFFMVCILGTVALYVSGSIILPF